MTVKAIQLFLSFFFFKIVESSFFGYIFLLFWGGFFIASVSVADIVDVGCRFFFFFVFFFRAKKKEREIEREQTRNLDS